jgi:hypothetical protein
VSHEESSRARLGPRELEDEIPDFVVTRDPVMSPIGLDPGSLDAGSDQPLSPRARDSTFIAAESLDREQVHEVLEGSFLLDRVTARHGRHSSL